MCDTLKDERRGNETIDTNDGGKRFSSDGAWVAGPGPNAAAQLRLT
jgi:hypothetical protein